MQELRPNTPRTHRLEALAIRDPEAREVRIVNLIEEVFYATVLVEGEAGTRVVDSRPSDAINLALVMGAPIRVAASVFVAAAESVGAEPVEQSDGPAEIVAELLASRCGAPSLPQQRESVVGTAPDAG